MKRKLLLTASIIAFGALMGFRNEVDGWILRSMMAAFAAVILVAGISYWTRTKVDR